MKSALLAFFATTMLVCLWGCAMGTYYAPSAGEGKVDGHGDWHAPNTLYLKRSDGISIAIDGGMFVDDTARYNDLYFDIFVRPHVTLHMPIEQIRVYSEDSSIITTSLSGISKQLSGPSQAKLLGTESELSGSLYEGEYGTEYILHLIFYLPKRDVFFVELPAMQTGAKSYPPLKVKFTKTHGWWIETIVI